MKKLMMVALAAGLAGMSPAEENLSDDERSWPSFPVGLGLAAPLQIPWMESDVTWVRLSCLYGDNANVRGLGLGLVQRAQTFRGLQVSGFGWTSGNLTGCAFGGLANVIGGSGKALEAGLANVTWGDFSGVSLGAVNYGGAVAGLEVGALVNWTCLGSRGLQVATVNADQVKYTGMSAGVINYGYAFSGLQLGVINLSEDMTGVQIGAINACDTLRGLQLGFINVVSTSPLPIMVIANASF